MGLYDINYGNLGQQILPPDKRKPIQSGWVKTFLKPMQRLRDLALGSWRIGADFPKYNPAANYSRYHQVIYKYSLYESLVDGNFDLSPLDTRYWMKVQDNFVGADERVQYNGHALVLTYALNKYFGTIFRQPDEISDIYLIKNAKPVRPFTIGYTEAESSKVYANTSSEFVGDSYTFDSDTNMSIWVPIEVHEALDTDPNNRDKIIRNFADRYVVAGITYNVKTY